MKRFLAITALVLLSFTGAWAQKISVVLKDKATGEAVPFATVSIIKEGEQKGFKYMLSDPEGKVTFEKIPSGSYTVKAELMGYKTFTKAVKVAKADLDLGAINMDIDAQSLEAASVSDVGNPIIIKKDTVEYNASSFLTSDNDMLENLLKKLPGFEVASDGSVTVGGQTITKITIDGKTFFLDDPALATKNIPAKIVKKVKVVEKKSDQALFTGIDDGEEETIIDLSLKPGMMKGLFGNVMAGGGHDVPPSGADPGDWRWQGAAMVGHFTENQQISVILNGNNTNNRGFNDMAGSMMRSMRGGGGGMGRGGGGWGQDNGITTSWMGGINGAWSLCDGRMDLGGNYLYNGSNTYVEERSTKETFKDDGSSLIYNSDGYSRNRSDGHRFGVRLDHKFSDATSILFQPQFSFGRGSFDDFSADTTLTKNVDGSREIANKGFTRNLGQNQSLSASGFLLFRQRLGKPGRTISTMFRYDISKNTLDGFNHSSSTATGADPEMVNQRFDRLSTGTNLSGRLVYTEPLGGDFYMEASYSYGWNRNISDKFTYNSGSYTDPQAYNPVGETKDDTYSNSISNMYQNHSAGVNFQYQKGKTRAQIGASYQPTITDNVTNGKTYHSLVHNWSPQAMVFYEFNDNSNIRLFYRGRSGQPSTSQLMPVPDNSNPLHISLGNPYLKPYFSHSLNGRFGYTDKETFFSIRGHIRASLTQNSITNTQWYTDSGVQYSMPVNGATTGNMSVGAFLNSPIAKSKFSISARTNFSFNASGSYVGKAAKSAEFTAAYYDFEKATFDYDAFNNDFYGSGATRNFGDYFEYSSTKSLGYTQYLRGTFRNDFLEFNLSGQTRMNKPWYSLKNAKANTTWNSSVQASGQYDAPFGLGIKADFSYNWYRGYTTAQPDEYILNAEISQLVWKKQMTIAIKAYDILNQAKNLTVSDTDNYHQEIRNNTLGRYIILSLTYRFGNFGKAGQMMRGGPGGHGPGGPGGPGGPMGPRR
ncbi:MAG: outer membrane beta-barrel protein [Bacteroidales bacterium]|nr:outer membrane beta-barrel protein [Bacteroidales bacterium]